VTRFRKALAACVVLPLVLSACTQTSGVPSETDAPRFQVNVDVDTPELRAMKKEAGVEPCRDGAGGNDSVAGGLPDLVLPCLGGGPDVHLASLRGPMVINLWAQWCGPCRAELPFYQELHERAGDQVEVVGIDYQDTQPQQALELIQETGVTYPLLADPAAKLRVPFRIRGLPGVVFVGPDGTVKHMEYVVIESYGQLRELVEQHLDVSLGSPA
jgi:thiol-disulfide isomerase/thioredoxin